MEQRAEQVPDMGEGEQSIKDRLGELRVEFAEKLPNRLDQIETLWDKLLHVKWDGDAFRILHRLVHSLAGSAGSFGFGKLGVAAKNVERNLLAVLEENSVPDHAERSRITALLEVLRQIPVSGDGDALPVLLAEEAVLPPEQVKAVVSVYLLEDDEELGRLIALQLRSLGYSVSRFAAVDALKEAIQQAPPAVLITDIMLHDHLLGGIELVAELRQTGFRDLPVVFVSARNDLSARLAAIRAGGNAYFTKPVDVEALGKRLGSLTGGLSQEAYRVLLLDTDLQQSDYLSLTLRQSDMATEVLTAPALLIQALGEFKPDLIMIDLPVPDFSAMELVQLVRQDEEFQDLPIILVAESGDGDDADMSQWVDAVLYKPLAPEQLLAAVAGRVQRGRELARRIQYLSKQDLLTGLCNRRYFLSALERVFNEESHEESNSAVLYFELDGFRAVRDRVGLTAADLLISDVAVILARQMREGETLSRFGDVAFALLVRERPAAQLEKLGRQLVTAVADEMYEVGGQSLTVSGSCGVALLKNLPKDARQWAADAAGASELARRQQGAAVYLHDPVKDLPVEQQREAHIQTLIRQALKEDRFRLVYQPIASLHGDRVEKYEVLLRMVDEHGGELLPSEFIPAAINQGLMADVDRWVLERAMQVLSEHYQDERSTVFFVKVTARFREDPASVTWLAKQLENARIPGRALVLELDEGSVTTTLKQALAFTEAVRRLGCGTALEHFGTRLDSFQILHHLNVDFVKIDGSFIHALSETPANLKTIQDVVERVTAEGVLTVAEFVEDAMSLSALWQCGLHYIQGNFLQEPDERLTFDFGADLG